MRILVISDSHGRNDDIEGVLKQVGDIDMMIHTRNSGLSGSHGRR